jgi:hypothetical protein
MNNYRNSDGLPLGGATLGTLGSLTAPSVSSAPPKERSSCLKPPQTFSRQFFFHHLVRLPINRHKSLLSPRQLTDFSQPIVDHALDPPQAGLIVLTGNYRDS